MERSRGRRPHLGLDVRELGHQPLPHDGPPLPGDLSDLGHVQRLPSVGGGQVLSDLRRTRNHRRRKKRGQAAAGADGTITAAAGGHMIHAGSPAGRLPFRRPTCRSRERSNAVQTSTMTFPQRSGERRNASNEACVHGRLRRRHAALPAVMKTCSLIIGGTAWRRRHADMPCDGGTSRRTSHFLTEPTWSGSL